jgi:hypothetical protein
VEVDVVGKGVASRPKADRIGSAIPKCQVDPVPLKYYRDRTGNRVVEGHLPDEDPGSDLDLTFYDLQRDVDHPGWTARDLFMRRQKGRIDQLLGHDLGVSDGEIDDRSVRTLPPLLAGGCARCKGKQREK